MKAVSLSMCALRLLPYLLFIFAVPSAAQGVDIKLSDRTLLRTSLAEARLITELDHYVIVAGRSCVDCDENTSIYIHKIPRPGNGVDGEGGDPGSADRYTYPGQYLDYESKELVEKTRMFYGECYEGQSSLLWLSEYRDGDGWVKSEYLILFGDDGLEHRYNANRQPSIFYIENTGCVELPGITAETEP